MLALIFAFGLGSQLLPLASAAQVTNRSVTVSSSAPSATNVTYTLTFTPGTSITHPDIILDFCSNDPLIGDSCTATAGTDVPDFTSAAAAGWTVTTIGGNRGVKLTTSSVSLTASTPATIVITGVNNPSNVGTNGSFYGRLLTYNNGGAGSNTSASPGSYVDYGGMALSTASNINVTSKVFETLAFCVFQTACGTAPALILGDPTTGALSISNAYVNSNAQYTIATNAANGVNITMTGNTLCRSTGVNCLTGASAFTISAVGGTASTSVVGNEQFGMCADVTGSGLTVAGTYKDTANNCHSLTTGVYAGTSLFGFNDVATTGGTNNAAGSQVISSSVAVPSYTGSFTFLGNINATTEAGIYTTSLNLVATGTF